MCDHFDSLRVIIATYYNMFLLICLNTLILFEVRHKVIPVHRGGWRPLTFYVFK